MLKKIFSMLGLSCLIAVFVLLLNAGLKKHEAIECQQWERDSKVYEGWYSTGWQKEQCLSYGIELK